MFDRREFAENMKKFDREFEIALQRTRRAQQIGLCLSTVFFLLLFALMVAGILFLAGNA